MPLSPLNIISYLFARAWQDNTHLLPLSSETDLTQKDDLRFTRVCDVEKMATAYTCFRSNLRATPRPSCKWYATLHEQGDLYKRKGEKNMTHIEHEIVINRPVEEVFDFVADGRNEPEYNPRILRVEQISPGPIGRGTRISVVWAR
jgi:Polyketide cyclase / dehydrase and lipid transport